MFFPPNNYFMSVVNVIRISTKHNRVSYKVVKIETILLKTKHFRFFLVDKRNRCSRRNPLLFQFLSDARTLIMTVDGGRIRMELDAFSPATDRINHSDARDHKNTIKTVLPDKESPGIN